MLKRIYFILSVCVSANLIAMFSSYYPEIVKASRDNEVSKLKTLLNQGVDVDERSSEGYTALMEASLHGYNEIVMLLISGGANVNAKNSSGMTPLILTSKSYENNAKTAEILINAGASVNERDNAGQNALISALTMGHADLAEYLIKHATKYISWDINIQDSFGKTALIAAAQNFFNHPGFKNIVQTLIRMGANINARDHLNMTAYQWAIKQGHQDIAELLKKYGAK
ncbi:ankyrin repeat domain-containing protein [Candidatus Dependentiae bacterium]|nr:ankyrin repeat domain-containing protein [Candidatus Dependentiae bacterium]